MGDFIVCACRAIDKLLTVYAAWQLLCQLVDVNRKRG